jgi:hypothetical protein
MAAAYQLHSWLHRFVQSAPVPPTAAQPKLTIRTSVSEELPVAIGTGQSRKDLVRVGPCASRDVRGDSSRRRTLSPWDAAQDGQQFYTPQFLGITHPEADGTRQPRDLRCAAVPLTPQQLGHTLGSSASLSRDQDPTGYRDLVPDALTRIALSSVYHPILSFFGASYSLHGA